MIRVAVLYPRTEDKSSDLNYYQNAHMKLVREKPGPPGLVSSEPDSGIPGMDGSPSPFFGIAYLLFETMEGFQSAFAKVGNELLADIPNYTDTKPIMQISDYQKF